MTNIARNIDSFCRKLLNLVKSLDHTVKPLITNTSEEFIKCRLDNFSMSFILRFILRKY